MARPAERIVSLAPHITENLFAAGVGAHVVGTVDYADFPPAAARLPRVGSYARIDLESLLALKPDLVIAWQSGNSPGLIDKLRHLGVPVYLSQTGQIESVATELERFARLGGAEREGATAAQQFRVRLGKLRAAYAERPTVKVFYEIWNQPLMTVGGKQMISDVIRLCGGDNVFAGIDALAPTVSQEAVLAANPEVIVAAGIGEQRPAWLDEWKKWSGLLATQRDNLFVIHPDWMHRPTPRLLDGAERLCTQLDQARRRR